MAKHTWHVERKEKPPSKRKKYGTDIIRDFNWITSMYKFILRNPKMFRGYTLQVYRNGAPMVEASFDDIQHRLNVGLKERQERNFIVETNLAYKRELKKRRLNKELK